MLHGNYKFYRGISKNYNENINEKQPTIISEETEKESSLTYLKYTNSLKKTSKKKSLLNSISLKKSIYDEIKNPINEIENEDEKMTNLPKGSSLLMDWNKMNKDNLIDNTEDNISKKSSYNKDINIEIYPGEVITVNKEDTLLCKKIDYNSKNKILNKPNNILESKNSKIEKLLNSF
jgi:LysM repeat protein